MTPLTVWDVSASDKCTVLVNVGGTAEGMPFVPVGMKGLFFCGGFVEITFVTVLAIHLEYQ